MQVRNDSGNHVVDSSGWVEYLVDGPNAGVFEPYIVDAEHLLIPALSVLEVFKWVLRTRGEDEALRVAALMQRGKVVDLGAALAIRAAKLGLEFKLPLADSVMLATARAYNATLWTQDADFQGIEGVEYVPKQASP